jgi:hypothetical protein
MANGHYELSSHWLCALDSWNEGGIAKAQLSLEKHLG